MESLVIDIKSKKDLKFFAELAQKMGFKAHVLSLDEKEEIALGNAIKEGAKGDYVSKNAVLKALRK